MGINKKLVILIFAASCCQVMAQKNKHFALKQTASALTMMSAGWLSATNEVATHDYRRFAARHPNANPQWANPRLSFRNKYVNWPVDKSPAFLGSKTILVWTTDRHHLYNTTRNALLASNVAITMSLYKKPNWKQIGIQALTSWAAFAIGSGLAHQYYRYVD